MYSASEIASQEFPDVDVSIRGAISIARRLQDPLAELILSGRVKDGDKVEISATSFGLTFNGKVAAAA